MNGTKDWYQSKTIWGAIITIASILLSFAGVHIDEQTKQVLVSQTTAFASAAGALAGSITVIYGRLKAKKKIK